MPVILIPDTSTGGPFLYGTVALLQAEIGQYNQSIFSDPDATNDPATMVNYLNDAGNFADDLINNRLSSYGFLVPQTTNLATFARIWQKLAAFQLYAIRGSKDKAGKGGGYSSSFQQKYDWAISQLNDITFINTNGLIRAPGYSDAPTSVGRFGVVPSTGVGCYGGYGVWPWRWGW